MGEQERGRDGEPFFFVPDQLKDSADQSHTPFLRSLPCSVFLKPSGSENETASDNLTKSVEEASKRLWGAVKSKDFGEAKAAFRDGADVHSIHSDSINIFGFSILGKVIDICHFSFVPLLLKHNADINFRDRFSRTPLMGAATAGSLSRTGSTCVVRLLICCGADLDARDYEGSTALHLGVHYNVLPTVEHLISAGADLNLKDFAGRTPLHRAIQTLPCDPLRMISLLLGYGANPYVRDSSGLSCLDYAFGTWNVPEEIIREFVLKEYGKEISLQLLCIRKIRSVLSGKSDCPSTVTKKVTEGAKSLPLELRERLGLCHVDEVIEANYLEL
mmetsp:Transcript_32713/g.44939  ORF Transcript_32713/g.44939 Transcript_32713/m.44939 type:complete len:331 (+) Transcript_32713:32-1024(+)